MTIGCNIVFIIKTEYNSNVNKWEMVELVITYDHIEDYDKPIKDEVEWFIYIKRGKNLVFQNNVE